jgi:transposase
MDQATIIGIDLAKRTFQAHGATSDGRVAFRRKLSRSQLLAFLTQQSRCVVAMEACATAHEWGRAVLDLGHEVRLPPAYVKPFVKRQKNDAADAEAIAEAASRPTMRIVAVKSEAQQARAMVFRTRDLLVRQRTQLINALRGHLAEHGIVAPQGPANVKRLADAINDAKSSLLSIIRDLGHLYLEQIRGLGERIAALDKMLRREAGGATTARLQTMPGVDPITAVGACGVGHADEAGELSGSGSGIGLTEGQVIRCWCVGDVRRSKAVRADDRSDRDWDTPLSSESLELATLMTPGPRFSILARDLRSAAP